MAKPIIGQTPMAYSAALSKICGCSVYIKEEYKNPGQSSKDRIACHMIEMAEKRGLLKPGYTVVEASSGNTAIGLALVCKQKGYPCILFLSKSASIEKVKIIRQLGASIQFCETSGGPEDPNSSQALAAEYARWNEKTYYCDQYFNPDNKEAHYMSTGPEIWDQLAGKITHFVSGVGTGGTISGVGEYLKEMNNNIKIWGVDPVGSILTQVFRKVPREAILLKPYIIEGIGRSFIPGSINFDTIDDFIQVDSRESALAVHSYYHLSGFMAGFSSGAVIAALLKMKSELNPTDRVVLLFPDRGDRYMSKLFNVDWLSQHVSGEDDWKKNISLLLKNPMKNEIG
jgi:cystathionine beta-synthase